MTTKINCLLVFVLFALLSFTACQDEQMEVINPNEQEALVPNSPLANLMLTTSANSGAFDNILDGSSCFSIELPVTIVVRDVTITIETEADLVELTDLFEDFNDDDDILDFIFPITIIFSDYSELVIENEDQLESFIYECVDDNDSIECVNFVYPITFSVFNSVFNLIDTIVIENDEALYAFLDDLEDDENALIVSLNYPVNLEYASGDVIEVNTNQELADAIEAAGDACDDDDACNDEFIESALVQCQWELVVYSTFPDFQGFYLEFNSDETFDIIINENQTLTEGNTWSVTSSNDDVVLMLGTTFEDLGGNWQITECDDDRVEFTKNNQTMVIEQDCEDDLECSVIDISGILQECPWDFTDGSENYNNYQIVFNANGELLIPEGLATSAIGGSWNLSATDNGIILSLSELTAFQDNLGGDWLIVECDDDRIVLSRENQTIVLEQDCLDESVLFNCFDDFEIVVCEAYNNVPVYNLSANTIGLITCTESFLPSFHAALSDAENNINPIENTEAYGTLTTQVYLRIEAESGNFEIFNIYLNTETCLDFDCFADTELTACSVNNDGTATFNLILANQECGSDIAIYGIYFYETLNEAQNNTNPISNPDAYINTANTTIVYGAVLNVSSNVIEHIFTVNLIPENCDLFSCFESFDAIIELCDLDEDGIEVFDLTIAFANCSPSADAVAYYQTEQDANTNSSPIANPEAYTNLTTAQQIIYVRVEIDNQFEVFPIQLRVIDCINNSCSEEQVDSFLLECIWNPTNYNGSDDLIQWNFDFESENQIVVIYTETQTTTASWTITQLNDGLSIEFFNVAGPNIQAITGSWLIVECDEGRLELHKEDNILVLERNCD